MKHTRSLKLVSTPMFFMIPHPLTQLKMVIVSTLCLNSKMAAKMQKKNTSKEVWDEGHNLKVSKIWYRWVQTAPLGFGTFKNTDFPCRIPMLRMLRHALLGVVWCALPGVVWCAMLWVVWYAMLVCYAGVVCYHCCLVFAFPPHPHFNLFIRADS